MKHLVIGTGEVGCAIMDVFETKEYWEVGGGTAHAGRKYDMMHVCFGYSEKFEKEVLKYQKKYNPVFTIVHSTVPVGTCRKLNALHSPIRGLHPNLYKGIMTFEKFIGGEQASLVADEFRRHGLKVILCDKQETTELGKLLDTEYYRTVIEFTHKAKSECDKHEVNFHETFSMFNLTYNSGYTKLGHEEYVRPTLQPIMTPISGHCVMPNKSLLEQS